MEGKITFCYNMCIKTEKIMRKLFQTAEKNKNFIIFALCFICINLLTSCYDVYEYYENPEGYNVVFTGTVKGDIDGDGIQEVVSGITITSNYAKTISDNNGSFEILAYFPINDGVSFVNLEFLDDKTGTFAKKVLTQIKPEDYYPQNILGYEDAYFSARLQPVWPMGLPNGGIIDLGEVSLSRK